MTNARQTAMDLYCLDEWPKSWERTRVACDCRSQACWILKRKGYGLNRTARILGFHDATAVRDSLNRFRTEGRTTMTKPQKRETPRKLEGEL